jgi:hypothetical protein
MGYDLKWLARGEVLRVELQNVVSIDELKDVNRQAFDILDKTDGKLVLLLDISALQVVYTTVEHLRNTQLYIDHPKLDTLVVIAGSKLHRLISLLAFHLSLARCVQCESVEQAQRFLTARQR